MVSVVYSFTTSESLSTTKVNSPAESVSLSTTEINIPTESSECNPIKIAMVIRIVRAISVIMAVRLA